MPIRFLALAFIAASLVWPEHSQSPTLPGAALLKPSPSYKQWRANWQQMIHRAAPGVDWEQIERDNRLRKFSQRNQRRASLSSSLKELTAEASERFSGLNFTGRWRELGSDDQAGRIVTTRYLSGTGQLLAIADGGQMWRHSENTGWQVINDTLSLNTGGGVYATATQSAQPRLALIDRFPTRLLYSDNDGQSWNNATLPALFGDSRGFDSWQADDNSIVLSLIEGRGNTAQFGVLQSTDGGREYTIAAQHSFDQEPSRFDPWLDRNTKEMFAAVSELNQLNVYRFAPDGQVDLVAENVTPNQIPESGVQLTGSGDTLYLAIESQEENTAGDNETIQTIYRSTDRGQTWSARTPVTTNVFFRRQSFVASPRDPDFLVIGGIDAFRSLDGGASWQRVNQWFEYYGDEANKLHADIPHFEFTQNASGDEIVFVSTDGGVFESRDRLETVRNISLTGLNNAQYYDTFTDPLNSHRFAAGSQDQGLQIGRVYDVNATGFEQIISGDYAYLGSSPDHDDLWSVYPGTVYYVNDLGVAPSGFARANFAAQDVSSPLFLPPLMVDPVSSRTAWVGTDVGGTVRLQRLQYNSAIGVLDVVDQPFDFGDASQGEFISAMAASTVDPNSRYIATGGGGPARFFFSTDGGESWTQQTGQTELDGGFLVGLAILPDPSAAGTVYLAGSGYSNPAVYRSTNHGEGFVDFAEGLPPTMVYQLASSADGQRLFAATESGPYAFSQTEQRWVDISGLAAPAQSYTSVEYLEQIGVARFGTYGRGVWDFEVATSETTFAQLEPGHSGVFFDPTHDGEGIFLEILENDQANLAWFTYQPDGRQAWVVALGRVEGRSIIFSDGLIPGGTRFGAAFDPSEITPTRWGEIAITFVDCNTLDFSYDGQLSFGRDVQNMQRLSGIQGLPCQQTGQPNQITEWAGTFYDPNRSGEGALIQPISAERALLTFYTFGPTGGQAWLIGDGTIDGDTIRFEQIQRPVDGQFGPDFDPGTVRRLDWGSITLSRADCDRVELNYVGPSDFGQGSYQLRRLSTPSGISCNP